MVRDREKHEKAVDLPIDAKIDLSGVPAKEFGLTVKERKFIELYLSSGNMEQAYVRAYPQDRKTTTAAKARAEMVLARPAVQKFIADRRQRVAQNVDVEISLLIDELRRVVFSSLDDVMEDGPEGLPVIKPISEIPAHALKTIQSVKTRVNEFGNEAEVRFYDKLRAMDLLGRVLGIFQESNTQGAAGTINITMNFGEKADNNIPDIPDKVKISINSEGIKDANVIDVKPNK